MKKILILGFLIASQFVSFAQQISGTASHVHDGDTFRLTKADGTVLKIRLANIDAPEIAQAHGQASRDFLAAKINERMVVVDIKKKDRYRRSIAVLFLQEENINRLLVANGQAWHYPLYSSDTALIRIENRARSLKVGLWQAENPTPPWVFREGKRTRRPRK